MSFLTVCGRVRISLCAAFTYSKYACLSVSGCMRHVCEGTVGRLADLSEDLPH